ncbi:thioredoxin family protein [Ramlibacter tataouinensis]|uniref:thioredoxin family protein n=1 Tax=Ramlibacter tataouinensis TaxID=94132 RepID=UPI0022F3BA43|nr:thioredoxin family protein [Ramlibacter tataouinensis]WBY00409.1 thioredoxin family protein [Ramlibacter tataouinensis]
MSTSSAGDSTGWQVICLCAAWCRVCGEWSREFEALAAAHPQARFAWVDVEDQADAMGDVEIETFPTLLVARGAQARFFGPVQPAAAQVARLLDALLADDRAAPATPPEAGELLQRLQAGVLPKG